MASRSDSKNTRRARAAQSKPNRRTAAKEAAPDPVFAAIEAHAKAWAAFEAVVSQEQALEDKLRPIEQRLGVDITTHRPSFDLGAGIRVEDEAGLSQFYVDLRKRWPGPGTIFSKSAWARACAKSHRGSLKRLHTARRKLKRLQDKHGWTAHERRYNAANMATYTTLEKLVRATPTTFAGLVTMAEWGSKNHEEHLEGQRWNAAELCFDTISALRSVSGKGRPVAKKRNAPKGAIEAVDGLSRRLVQARAILLAISNADLSEDEMANALWGVRDLLEQADAALSDAFAEFRKEVAKARLEGPEPKPDPLRGFRLVHDISKGDS